MSTIPPLTERLEAETGESQELTGQLGWWTQWWPRVKETFFQTVESGDLHPRLYFVLYTNAIA